MPTPTPAVPPTGLSFKHLAASGLVKTGEGDCYMVKIASSSSLTIRLWDNTAASGTKILDTMAVFAGEEHYVPAHFGTGLYVEFIAGSGSVTAFFI